MCVWTGAKRISCSLTTFTDPGCDAVLSISLRSAPVTLPCSVRRNILHELGFFVRGLAILMRLF